MNRGDGDLASLGFDPASADLRLKTGFNFPLTAAKISEGVKPVGAAGGMAATPTDAMVEPTVESKLQAFSFLKNLLFSFAPCLVLLVSTLEAGATVFVAVVVVEDDSVGVAPTGVALV